MKILRNRTVVQNVAAAPETLRSGAPHAHKLGSTPKEGVLCGHLLESQAGDVVRLNGRAGDAQTTGLQVCVCISEYEDDYVVHVLLEPRDAAPPRYSVTSSTTGTSTFLEGVEATSCDAARLTLAAAARAVPELHTWSSPSSPRDALPAAHHQPDQEEGHLRTSGEQILIVGFSQELTC
jgi:hypothetical protein